MLGIAGGCAEWCDSPNASTTMMAAGHGGSAAVEFDASRLGATPPIMWAYAVFLSANAPPSAGGGERRLATGDPPPGGDERSAGGDARPPPSAPVAVAALLAAFWGAMLAARIWDRRADAWRPGPAAATGPTPPATPGGAGSPPPPPTLPGHECVTPVSPLGLPAPIPTPLSAPLTPLTPLTPLSPLSPLGSARSTQQSAFATPQSPELGGLDAGHDGGAGGGFAVGDVVRYRDHGAMWRRGKVRRLSGGRPRIPVAPGGALYLWAEVEAAAGGGMGGADGDAAAVLTMERLAETARELRAEGDAAGAAAAAAEAARVAASAGCGEIAAKLCETVSVGPLFGWASASSTPAGTAI
eukprot:gene26173-60904_t